MYVITLVSPDNSKTIQMYSSELVPMIGDFITVVDKKSETKLCDVYEVVGRLLSSDFENKNVIITVSYKKTINK